MCRSILNIKKIVYFMKNNQGSLRSSNTGKIIMSISVTGEETTKKYNVSNFDISKYLKV